MKYNYNISASGILVKSESFNTVEHERDVKDKSGTIKRINAQDKQGNYSRTTYSYMRNKKKGVPDNPQDRIGITQKEYRYSPEKQEMEVEHTGTSGSGKHGVKTTMPTTSKYEKELKNASQEVDLEKSEDTVTGHKRADKDTFITQHKDGATVHAKSGSGKKPYKDTKLYTRYTHTTHDPETGNVKVQSDRGSAEYPTHVTLRDYDTGKETQVANAALPKKSFSSDDVTVARLLKDKSPEEAQILLDTLGLLDKAISSVYSTSGALSSKRSGGHEGVKLMGEIDKHKRKEPSELDPGHKTPVSVKPASLAPSNEELTSRKVNPKGLEALKRMSGSTVKSIMDLCDDILNKAKGTQPKDRSLLEGPYGAEAQARYDKKKPAIEAHAKKNKENIASAGRAVEHFRSKADEGFGDEGESEEKSLSLDFNKSILERMGLAKGRKSAWESKASKGDSDVRVPHSSDSSAGNLNPETEEKIQGIRDAGGEKNKKRMMASTDPSDVAYAKKQGWV